jgi:spermidine synthase
MKKYFLEIIVFICGAAVMVLELVGSRVLAPYVGTSIIVWASLIGVILGSLSLGYWWGGAMADRQPTFKRLSLIILLSAIYILLVGLCKDPVLSLIQRNIHDIRFSSLIATVLLFAPPGILLGIVSPYAVKLRMNNLSTSGRDVGNLYAISTVGSIVGTFSAGFVLLVYLGNTNILYFISLTLIIASVVGYSTDRTRSIVSAIVFVFALCSIIAVSQIHRAQAAAGYRDVDTLYQRIIVYQGTDSVTSRPIREMRTDFFSVQSAMFSDRDDDLVVAYTKRYRLVDFFVPQVAKALMIGGGAYSYPKDFLQKFPEAQMDVVEIDPMVTRLAREHFNLPDNPRLHIFHEDGRVYLNNTDTKYDAIFIDAFKSFYSIPYQLSTRESVQQQFRLLNDDGAVLVNIASAIDGDKGIFLRAEYATYRSIFPVVYLFQVSEHETGTNLQNVMLVAMKKESPGELSSADAELNGYLSQQWTHRVAADVPVLNDERAPVDYYLMKTL